MKVQWPSFIDSINNLQLQIYFNFKSITTSNHNMSLLSPNISHKKKAIWFLYCSAKGWLVWLMVLNAAFNHISVEEITDLSQVTGKLYLIMLYLVHLVTLVVIGTEKQLIAQDVVVNSTTIHSRPRRPRSDKGLHQISTSILTIRLQCYIIQCIYFIKKLPLYNGGKHPRGTNVCV